MDDPLAVALILLWVFGVAFNIGQQVERSGWRGKGRLPASRRHPHDCHGEIFWVIPYSEIANPSPKP